jgi:zinc transporter 1
MFSLLTVIILARGCAGLFVRTASTVVERCPDSVNAEEIAEEIAGIEGVVGVHDLHIWEFSKDRGIAMMHIVVKSRDMEVEILSTVQNLMMVHGVHNVTAQVEAEGDFPDGVDPRSHCAFASAMGALGRVFAAEPAFQHAVGCPHANAHGSKPG